VRGRGGEKEIELRSLRNGKLESRWVVDSGRRVFFMKMGGYDSKTGIRYGYRYGSLSNRSIKSNISDREKKNHIKMVFSLYAYHLSSIQSIKGPIVPSPSFESVLFIILVLFSYDRGKMG